MAGLLGAVILRKGLERIGTRDTASPLVAGEGKYAGVEVQDPPLNRGATDYLRSLAPGQTVPLGNLLDMNAHPDAKAFDSAYPTVKDIRVWKECRGRKLKGLVNRRNDVIKKWKGVK